MEHNKNWGKNIVHERFLTILKYLECGDKILDIGSGRGAYTKELNQLGYDTVGIDIVRYQEWANNKAKFILSNSENIPFRNKCFDISIVFEVMEHVENYQKMLAEIQRCTKKFLVLSVPNCELNNKLRNYDLAMAHWVDQTHVNFFTKDTLRKTLLENGFDIVSIEDCYEVSVNNYYWDTLRFPRIIKELFKILINSLNLSETYWSSILVVGKIS